MIYSYKQWIKILYIIPITLLLAIYLLISNKLDIPIGIMMKNRILGQISGEGFKASVYVLENLYYLVVFNILFGNIVYRDFRYSSIYLFSRLKDRKKWLYKRALYLLSISAGYTGVFLGVQLWICSYSSNHVINRETLGIIFLLFIMLMTTLMLTTFLINMLSIRFGNVVGFLAIYTCVIVLILLAINHEKIPLIGDYYWIRMLNPMYSIILQETTTVTTLVIMIFYYLFLIMIAMVISANYINKFDIALIDYECN